MRKNYIQKQIKEAREMFNQQPMYMYYGSPLEALKAAVNKEQP